MITNVYIDGFNLYYGCLKQTRFKWLNVRALAEAILPRHSVNRIRYFTARVSSRPGDGDMKQQLRQQLYLRALETVSNLTIHEGHYLSHPCMMRVAAPAPGDPKFVEVIKTEEKGSDVNIATYLLLDAFRKDFEQALIISNDSDLALPIEVVRNEFSLPVGVAFPCSNPKRVPSAKLRSVATFTRDIRENSLRKGQFSAELTDATGRFTKPREW